MAANNDTAGFCFPGTDGDNNLTFGHAGFRDHGLGIGVGFSAPMVGIAATWC
jgi:hypothetical protein